MCTEYSVTYVSGCSNCVSGSSKLKAKVISDDGKVIEKLKGTDVLVLDAEEDEYLLEVKSKVGKKEERLFYVEVVGVNHPQRNRCHRP